MGEADHRAKASAQVHQAPDRRHQDSADLSVNGVNVRIARNVPTWIKRMHLEVLARMKETRVTQDLTPNREGEITMDSLRGNTGLAYPFTVLQDKNPKGGAWLANVLAERG